MLRRIYSAAALAAMLFVVVQAADSSYYLLKGKILNNGATISGTYMNLTPPGDFGTFSISK